jgi:hypothetical protein
MVLSGFARCGSANRRPNPASSSGPRLNVELGGRPTHQLAGSGHAEFVALGIPHHDAPTDGLVLLVQNGGACLDQPLGVPRARFRPASPSSPALARMSRCTLFPAVWPSGTGWKNSRGRVRSGSTTAARHRRGWYLVALGEVLPRRETRRWRLLLVVQRERPEPRHDLEVVHVEGHLDVEGHCMHLLERALRRAPTGPQRSRAVWTR